MAKILLKMQTHASVAKASRTPRKRGLTEGNFRGSSLGKVQPFLSLFNYK
jgi:hypothetical protein